MTNTSVKGVSTMLNTLTAGVNSQKNTGAASFQDIWNQQTDRNSASMQSGVQKAQAREKAQRGDALQQKNVQNAGRKKLADADKPSGNEVSETDAQKQEEAMEVLAAGAEKLLQEIADTFGMSREELEQLMADMNMQAADLLDTGKLSALLLAAGGASDSMALLTDENLCADFQMMMNRQKEILQEICAELHMSPEQLAEELEKMQADAALNALDSTETQESAQAGAEAVQQETADAAVDRTDTAGRTETKQQAKEDGHRQQNSYGNEQGNLLLQNLKADSISNEASQTARTSPWSENTQNIMNQIMDYMRVQLKADTSSLEMQLHPASLGTLQVNVASKGGILTANFITQNEAVKTVLESQMIQLKESFAEQGVKVEAIEVTVQTHQFESNLEQGRGRQQEELEKKNRPRRIQLNGSYEGENAEELTGEEKLAAAIMTANGGTVDYTA